MSDRAALTARRYVGGPVRRACRPMLSAAAGVTVSVSLLAGCTSGEEARRDGGKSPATAGPRAGCGREVEFPDGAVLTARDIWKSADGTFGRSVNYVSLAKDDCTRGSATLERFDCEVFPWTARGDTSESLAGLGVTRWGSITFENKGGASVVREYVFMYDPGAPFPDAYRAAARRCGATTNVTVNGKPSDLLIKTGDTERVLIVDDWHVVAIETKRGDDTVKPIVDIANAAVQKSLLLR